MSKREIQHELAAKKTLDDLEKCFLDALANGTEFVAVKMQLPGMIAAEVIINPLENFDSKMTFYRQTYNDNLENKKVKGLEIVDFVAGDNFREIQNYLLGKMEG